MDRLLRGAIIGFGQVAEKAHLPGFRAAGGFEIVAAAETHEQRRLAAGAALPGARLYPSAEALLASEDLDFVDIATPPSSHAPLALLALRRGRHVLCEKPLTLELEQLEALRSEAERAHKAVFTVHNWAYAPQWLKAWELLPSLGEVSFVCLSVARSQPAAGALPGDWRRDAAQAGGGVLVDHGWHNLYLLRRLLPSAAQRVTSRLLDTAPNGIEDAASVFFEYPGASAVLQLSWRCAARDNHALIQAQHGTLEVRDDEVIVNRHGQRETFSYPERLSAASAHPTWFAAMLGDFRRALTLPAVRAVNFSEADFCVKMIRRAYHSARAGRNPLRQSTGPRSPAKS